MLTLSVLLIKVESQRIYLNCTSRFVAKACQSYFKIKKTPRWHGDEGLMIKPAGRGKSAKPLNLALFAAGGEIFKNGLAQLFGGAVAGHATGDTGQFADKIHEAEIIIIFDKCKT